MFKVGESQEISIFRLFNSRLKRKQKYLGYWWLSRVHFIQSKLCRRMHFE